MWTGSTGNDFEVRNANGEREGSPASGLLEFDVLNSKFAIREMIIARVVGSVIASQKQESHHGKKILLLQPLDLDGRPAGDVFIALDAVDAGVGDRVLAVQEGFSAMTSVGHTESPIDAAVVGVVDRVTLE